MAEIANAIEGVGLPIKVLELKGGIARLGVH